MKMSYDLISFLKKNKIFTVQSLSKLSIKKIMGLPGFKKPFLEQIANAFDTEIDKIESDSSKKSFSEKNNTNSVYQPQQYEKYVTVVIDQHEIRLSNRLYNILYSNGFDERLHDFVRLPDSKLISYAALGKKTLDEVYEIRQKLLSKDEISSLVRSGKSSTINKISIPFYLKHLDTSILQNLNLGYPPLEKSLNSISKKFPELGDFDGKKGEDILSTRAIGKKKAQDIILWFQGFFSGTFSEMIPKIFKKNTTVKLSQIHFSYRVSQLFKNLNIKNLYDIHSLDKYESTNLKFEEKFALLELRTLHYDLDKKRYSTRTNHRYKIFDPVSDLDVFIAKYLVDRSKDFALQRWGNKEVCTLSDIGLNNNMTRERARQILHKIKSQFIGYFFPDYNDVMDKVFKIYLNKKDVITLHDILPRSSNEMSYGESFYENFFNELFKPIPIGGFINKGVSVGSDEKELYIHLKRLAEFPFELKFDDLCDMYDKEKMIQAMVIINRPDTVLKFVEKKGKTFINKTYYSSFQLAKYVIKNSESVLSINNINNKIVKLGGKENEHLGLIGRLNEVDDIYLLDYQVFGSEENFGYTKSNWSEILENCTSLMNDFGHQMSASAIFNEIKSQFPKLRSKYELVYILRSSKKIKDLGFHTFTLKKFGQNDRLRIKEVVIKILESSIIPINRNSLYDEIIKQRTFRKEGLSTFHRWEEVNLYSPGYFGLNKNHDKNLKYLSTHLPFIKSYIINKVSYSLDMTVDTLVGDINYNGDKASFLSLINKDKDLVVLNTNEGEFVDYLLHNKFSTKKCATIILCSYKRKMLINELILLIKSGLPSLRDNQLKGLKYLSRYLKKSKKVIFDGKYYLYNSNYDKISKYGLLLGEIKNTLVEWGELIYIDDLFKLLQGIDRLPKNSLMLKGLIKLDDRFDIHEGNLIGLSNKNEPS